MSIKAYILVVTDPGATKRVFDALAAVPGVTEIHEVMGPYDIIAEIEVPNLVDVPPILSSRIRIIPGIQSTTSLVSFPENE
jgi:DNA-binding Lrp family transcriptional regulator